MKKLLIILLCLPFIGFGQQGQTIWYDDCSDISTWTLTNSSTLGVEWGIEYDPNAIPSADLSPFASTSASNGYMFISSDADGGNADNDGTTISAEFTNTTPIDLTNYYNVQLTFQHCFRWWHDTRIVRISSDNGVTWIELDEISNNQTYSYTNQTSNNPHMSTYDISTIAGGHSEVLVQFYYNDNDWWAWFWAVDDIAISVLPDNMITCTEEVMGGWWIGYQDPAGGLGQDYTFNPISQATANPYTFEAVLTNEGTMPQHAMLHVDVNQDTTGASVFSSTSNLIILSQGEQDTVAANSTFTPTTGGLYTVDMWAVADSAGLGNVITSTDTATKMTMVTDYQYGKDNGTNDGGYWRLNRGAPMPGGFEVSSNYDIYSDITLYSVDAHISDWSIPGAEVYVILYEEDLSGINPIPLAQSDSYTITSADLGAWVNIPFVSPQLLFSSTKQYRIAIGANMHPTDTVGIDVSSSANGSYSADGLFDKDGVYANGFPTWYSISDIPMLRMNFDPLTFGSLIYGCTDYIACNYDPLAHINDSTLCLYIENPVVDLTLFSYTFLTNSPYDFMACDEFALTINFYNNNIAEFSDTNNIFLDSSFIFSWSLCNDSLIISGYLPIDPDFDFPCTYSGVFIDSVNSFIGEWVIEGGWGGDGCFEMYPDEIFGCKDTSAANYDPLATIDDSSCVYCNIETTFYYSNPTDSLSCDGFALIMVSSDFPINSYLWQNSTGNIISNSNIITSLCNDAYIVSVTDSIGCLLTDTLIISTVPGCTDNSAINYNVFASYNDGSCIYAIYGCTEPDAFNYDPLANTNDSSCVAYIYGCTDSLAYNYNPSANINDPDINCLYCDLSISLFVNQNSSINTCDGWAIVSATSSNSNFIYEWNNGDDNNYLTGLCSGIYIVTVTDGFGCSMIDSMAIGYTYGCTDSLAVNYNPNANYDNGSCIFLVFGCTNPASANYNPNATVDDGSCIFCISCLGCTDPLATNYDPNVSYDDGSCIYSETCSGDLITGLYVDNIIDDRVVLHFDNMNTYDANGNQICRVDQIRIKYREVGTNTWSQKNIASPTGYDANGVCNSTQKTNKNVYGLSLANTYEWEVKVWYCDGQTTGWAPGPNFTTADECPNVRNTNAYGSTPTKATFTWDDSNGAYEFVRIKIRVDSIQNPSLSDFIQVGGTGVPYGIFTKDKNGLTPGETYRGQARTWCSPNGGAYNSLGWTPFLTWTQPTNRIDGGETIKNLDIYPNPSRDVFNITFTSEDVQDLRVVVRNILGEELIIDDLQQFVGEYIKVINLNNYSKGIYLLEIETNQGIINKKLILH